MLLCNLPEDILAVVLRRCAFASHNATNNLERNLPLLAVCRQWRRLAMPLVYKHAFVQYRNLPEGSDVQSTLDPHLEEPTNVAVKTNLDLIAMNGCARAVRYIDIYVHCVENPFPGWREVVQRMRAVASKWRVAELTVAMYPLSVHSDDHAVDMAEYTDDVAEVSGALAALMPDVRRLHCGGECDSPFEWSVCGRLARSLYGRLAGHYAEKLRVLNSTHPITVPLDCQFTGLKKLDVAVDRVADYQLPQMASGELVNVRLLDGPPNHSWASFSTDSDSRVIEFTKLKSLYVAYSASYQEGGVAVHHRDGHPWRLHFPSLKSLDIMCSQDICPLLEYAVLPPRMEYINILMISAAFQDIADLVLPEAKYFSLGISQYSGGDPSGLPAINRILERARGSKILELNIVDRRLPVLPETITCTALTHLAVTAPISVDTMLAFFARLSRLTQMSLFDLDLSAIQADMSIPGADEGAVVEPLSQSLESLTIYYNMMRQSPDMEVAVAVAKYILLRVPTLTRLLAGQTPKDAVLSFVEEYAPRYPHLRGVELKLRGCSDSATTGF